MIEYIKEGFRLAHKNYQLILIQIAVTLIIFIGFILLVFVPLAVAFVYFGIDLTRTADFLDIFRNPEPYISRYLGLIVLIIATFIVYICFASILSIFALGGILGVLRSSFLNRQYKLSLSSFFKEGKSLFPSMLGFAFILLLGLIAISFMLGILVGIGFSVINAYTEDSFPSLFIAYFLGLLVVSIGIIIAFGGITLSAYALTIIVVERSRTLDAFRMSFNFLKKKPRALLFYAVIALGYMVIDFMLIILNYPFTLIPLIGVFLNIPYNMLSYILLNYLLIVASGALIVFYLKNAGYSVHSGAYEI
ncbi:MAG: hypothetical protein HY756_02425 [Nitrospirae bacterium]|nr:hypothetical protein [Nitrospirota bacterium]